MNEAEREFNMIMTADTTGVIACMIAKQIGQTPYEAFRGFFNSNTYRKFRNPDSYMNNWGPGPIVKAYLQELDGIDWDTY